MKLFLSKEICEGVFPFFPILFLSREIYDGFVFAFFSLHFLSKEICDAVFSAQLDL